ncbi:hypothetical protein LguiB_022867 [Lonicera macranthoides]
MPMLDRFKLGQSRASGGGSILQDSDAKLIEHRVKETHAVSLNKVTNNQMKEIAHPIQRTLNSKIRRLYVHGGLGCSCYVVVKMVRGGGRWTCWAQDKLKEVVIKEGRITNGLDPEPNLSRRAIKQSLKFCLFTPTIYTETNFDTQILLTRALKRFWKIWLFALTIFIETNFDTQNLTYYRFDPIIDKFHYLTESTPRHYQSTSKIEEMNKQVLFRIIIMKVSQLSREKMIQKAQDTREPNPKSKHILLHLDLLSYGKTWVLDRRINLINLEINGVRPKLIEMVTGFSFFGRVTSEMTIQGIRYGPRGIHPLLLHDGGTAVVTNFFALYTVKLAENSSGLAFCSGHFREFNGAAWVHL